MDGFQVPMLVYEYKCNGRNLVPNGLSVLDEEALVIILSMNDDIRAVKKAIEPGRTTVDIYKVDLMTESEKQAASNGKKKKGAEAKEKVPWKAFLGHSFENHSYEEMIILVPEVVAKGGKEQIAK